MNISRMLRLMPLSLLLLPSTVLAQSDTAHKRPQVAPRSVPGVLDAMPTAAAQRAAATAVFEQSLSLSRAGDAAAKQRDWKDAAHNYNGALSLWSSNPSALYGLAKCAKATGDTQAEFRFYRSAIYNPTPAPYRATIREVNPDKLMDYALELARTGQTEEAMTVYDRAADEMDGSSGEALAVAVPMFGDGPGLEPYSPQEFEAMAHLALFVEIFGHEGYGDPEPLTHLQKALALAPDSAAANY
jgi:tetratricopeptide (TPR) repeat protein